MSGTRPWTAGTTRRAVAVALGTLVAVLLPVLTATAAPAQGSIAFAITDSESVPATAGSDGLVYVVQDDAFSVTLTFLDRRGVPTPVSNSDDTPVTLRYGTTTLATQPSLAAGESTVTFSGLWIAAPATGVVLTADATTKNGQTLTDSSDPFDVLIESRAVTGPTSVGGDQEGTEGDCNPTASAPICGDLLPPANGFDPASTAKLSQGCLTNSDCENRPTFVQALAQFSGTGGGSVPAPATLKMNCDKTVCGGGAINKKKLYVTLAPDPDATFGGEVVAPACVAKGVVTYDPALPYGPDNRPFCVDYVQSTRDIAGDTILYLLFVLDAKVRFP